MGLSRALWLALSVALGAVVLEYAAYAAGALRFRFGLDYSEGLIWQQALWLGSAKLYGDIATFPFLVCQYPPLYLVVVRAVHVLGIGMLAGGRTVSVASLLASCAMVGALVWRDNRSLRAAALAGLLPLSLLPVMSWSVLMRVDMLALALTYAGLLCARAAFLRARWLFAALAFFVAAVFTKQIYVAGAVAMLPVFAIRAPRLAVPAYAAGAALGLALTGLLEWQTDGRFLHHILGYTVEAPNMRLAVQETAHWLTAYAIYAVLTGAAVVVLWRQALRTHRPGGFVRAVREDDRFAWLVFLSLYLVLTSVMLVAAGKTGASRNYFIEWLCCWCLWLGCLAGQPGAAPALVRWWLPGLVIVQLWPVLVGLNALRAEQFSAQRREDWGGLLARVRAIPGPLLSDDMVLTIEAGREVVLEPAVLHELSRAGLWDEQRLIDRLKTHYFGAVITAYDPGDPTFDARYLPRTQAALLSSYPHVQAFGDYRLRTP